MVDSEGPGEAAARSGAQQRAAVGPSQRVGATFLPAVICWVSAMAAEAAVAAAVAFAESLEQTVDVVVVAAGLMLAVTAPWNVVEVAA